MALWEHSASTLSWADAALRVARVVNGQDDTDQVAIATEHISDVFKKWNAKRRWKFLLTTTPASGTGVITTVLGTATYELPDLYKKSYAAYLVTSKRWLKNINEQEYIRSGGPAASNATPGTYQLGNAAGTGLITLSPPPSVAEVLRVWYYRRMAERYTSVTTEKLDILADYEGFLLDEARARMIAEKGPTDKLEYWNAKGGEGFALAALDDEELPDLDIAFTLNPEYFNYAD